MLDFEKSFESVVEIYSGFPLKANFLELGNAALKSLGVVAEYEDGVIRIPYLSRPYYNEEELEGFREDWMDDDAVDEISKWKLCAQALIMVKDPKSGITDADCECWAEGPTEDDEVYPEDDMYPEEYDRAIELIEAFLNVAVDAG